MAVTVSVEFGVMVDATGVSVDTKDPTFVLLQPENMARAKTIVKMVLSLFIFANSPDFLSPTVWLRRSGEAGKT